MRQASTKICINKPLGRHKHALFSIFDIHLITVFTPFNFVYEDGYQPKLTSGIDYWTIPNYIELCSP